MIYGSECTYWFEDVKLFCGERATFVEFGSVTEPINVLCDKHRKGAHQRIPSNATCAPRTEFWTSRGEISPFLARTNDGVGRLLQR